MAFYSCSAAFTFFTWIWTFIGIAILPISIWALIKHLKQEKKKDKTPQILSKSTLLFYVTTILTLLSTALYKVGWCTSSVNPVQPGSHGVYSIGRKIFGSLWVLQSFLLMLIIFSRLYYAFAGSVYQVSKCTLYFFIFLAVFFFISYVWHLIAAIMDDLGPMWVLSFVVLFFAMAINSLYLSVIFIYKLYRISKMEMSLLKETSLEMSKTGTTTSVTSCNEKNATDEMTKITILAVTSVSVTLLLTLMTMFFDLIGSEIQDMIWHLCVLLDIFTNFLCITLAATFAEKYYFKLCGAMDYCCRRCCVKVNARNELSNYVESNKKTPATDIDLAIQNASNSGSVDPTEPIIV